MRCLVFDIYGDFGHFRKFYTTSSPLTFSFPPRTAIGGLISAVVGLNKEEYLKYFLKEEAFIGIRILSPVKKHRISYNLIDTKTAKLMSKIQNRTQVTYEVLKDCRFRIYFYHKNKDLYDKIVYNIKTGLTNYTLCLGLSEFIANIRFSYESDLSLKKNGIGIYIDSVIPFNEESLKVIFEEGKEYFKDTMPNEMNEDREVTEYIKVLYERNGKPIRCDIDNFYETEEDEHIVFL